MKWRTALVFVNCYASKPCKDNGKAQTGILFAKCDFAKDDNGMCQFSDQITTDFERTIKFDRFQFFIQNY